ncbi:hypothetical protein L6452_15577 [Arctium lappa]|uniref:Uncharacterized protein n=1 Tax=Arctium lappa TaxID=4217 RepID=A0ACB9CP59_ARCLA|nr:hypothetical protein L6452_15577 [Arctium lappa]
MTGVGGAPDLAAATDTIILNQDVPEANLNVHMDSSDDDRTPDDDINADVDDDNGKDQNMMFESNEGITQNETADNVQDAEVVKESEKPDLFICGNFLSLFCQNSRTKSAAKSFREHLRLPFFILLHFSTPRISSALIQIRGVVSSILNI